MATVEFRVPDLGEGLTEATILRWLVAVGDEVALNQPLCDVETDKAETEVPSPQAGRVVALGGAEGDTVAVGELLVRFETSQPAEEGPVLVGSGPLRPDAAVSRRRRAVTAPSGPGPGPVPSGRGGERALADGDELVRLDGVRARMAERMRRAHRDIPAAAARRELDATALVHTAARLSDAAGSPFSPFALLAGITVVALGRHRWLNATMGDDGATVQLHRRVNLSFAVDTPHGLVAPVVADAAALTVPQLAAELTRLASAARERRLTPAEVSGGTFTLTNHGSVGTDDGLAIVNPPQLAILAVGAIRARPYVVAGAVQAVPTVHLTCVFDHRALDGAQVGRFLGELHDLMGGPVDPAVALGEW